MHYRLENVQHGYCEIVAGSDSQDLTYECSAFGYVQTETFVTKTDFEKDKIYTCKRWVAYVSYRDRIGRETGYKTRKEAIEAFLQYTKKLIEKEGLEDGTVSD